jgi:hypothetical protein
MFAIGSEQRGYALDVQHIRANEGWTIQSGLLFADQDETKHAETRLPGFAPVVVAADDDLRRLGVYSYVHFAPSDGLTLTGGASLDDVESSNVQRDALNKKLSVAWRPTAHTTLRAAAFETLFGSLTTSTQNTQPNLEPVQLAGFTQLLFGGLADESEVRGLGLDHELSARTFIGWQAELREIDRTVLSLLDPTSSIAQHVTLRERTQHAYLYWTPSDRLSVSARYERGRYHSEPLPLIGYTTMKLARLPLEVRYFAHNGLIAGLRASRIAQRGMFPSPSPFDPFAVASGADRFWIFDAFVGYRLPRRRGLLFINADNLLDERFRFQDIDPTNPSLIPERMLSVRFTLSFD